MRWLAATLIAWIMLAAVPVAAAETRDPYTYFFHPNTGDLRAELADAKAAGKKAVFLMFEQEGCPGCIYMKERVLNRPDVQDFYRSRFLNFAIDIFAAVPITDFSSRDLTEKTFAGSLNIKGTPTLLFYDLAGNEVVRIVGPVREPAEFLLLGEFVASGAYKTRKFAQYKLERRPGKGS